MKVALYVWLTVRHTGIVVFLACCMPPKGLTDIVVVPGAIHVGELSAESIAASRRSAG